jgi:hypothetical protein
MHATDAVGRATPARVVTRVARARMPIRPRVSVPWRLHSTRETRSNATATRRSIVDASRRSSSVDRRVAVALEGVDRPMIRRRIVRDGLDSHRVLWSSTTDES